MKYFLTKIRLSGVLWRGEDSLNLHLFHESPVTSCPNILSPDTPVNCSLKIFKVQIPYNLYEYNILFLSKMCELDEQQCLGSDECLVRVF